MPRNKALSGAVSALASMAAVPAEACTISATGVPFGSYDPSSGTADDGTGTISLDCQPSVQSPVIALGAGGAGSFAPRQMASGAYLLGYNLYTTAARNVVWGDGASGTVTLTLGGGTVTAGTRHFSQTVYGRITALQNVGAGTYGDTIIVTVTF